MMVLASIGLVRSGFALGAGERRDRGLFGFCQERAKQNAANIEQTPDFKDPLEKDDFKLRSDVNDKIFMVTTILAARKSVQKEILEKQNRNWNFIREYFETSEHIFHVLPYCDQLLSSR